MREKGREDVSETLVVDENTENIRKQRAKGGVRKILTGWQL